MKMIKFPSIEQFRTIVKNIKTQSAFLGMDNDGKPIYDPSPEYPILRFKGTVKLHGTNAGICYHNGSIWSQSRENIITPEKDNAGFAFFIKSKEEIIKQIFQSIDVDSNKVICLYGEWCGKGIQKGVAMSELDKMLVLFGLKIYDPGTESSTWINMPDIEVPEHRIFNINKFKTYFVEVDFSKPEFAQNEFVKLTEEVEQECPVAKHFGVSGIGEGIVWSHNHPKYGNILFKTKGEKHSASKVKTIATIDTAKIESIDEFVKYAVTENRLNQAIEYIFTQNGENIDIKKMGDYLRWVMQDIIKEELDTLSENNLEPKDIGKKVSEVAKKFFMEKWNEI